MKNNRALIEKTIIQARKRWAYDEQWKIEWKFSDRGRESGGGYCDFEPYAEKNIRVELNPDYEFISNLRRVKLDIYHELGHPIISPVWRAATDWADHLIPEKGKMRAVFEESINSAENLVIDPIVTQVFKI